MHKYLILVCFNFTLMMGNLFNKYFLSEYVANYRKECLKHIDKLEITESTNMPAMVQRLVKEYTIEPIEIMEPQPSQPIETTRKMTNRWNETYEQKVFEISVVIPFKGNKNLFYCSPSRSTVVYLDKNASIGSDSISVKITLEKLEPEKYQAELNTVLGTLKCNLPIIHSEISPWNNGLENLVESSLQSRKGVVSQKFDFMEKIGLKVNPASGEHLIPPTVTKKVIPIPVSDTTSGVKREAIPVLQDQVYKDIKEVLYNSGRSIERKPSLYLGKYEEDLRDVFLLFLESRYEAASGVGEAFNKKGKTDILLKYAKDGSNLFVAECKFWKGQKSFLLAINQLLGYLTHRDSKTALMMFVDQKEFMEVVETVKESIKDHPHFYRYVKDTYDHSLSYEFSLPDDSRKIIQIEVMLFHFPKP